ncbi:tripartite tricarboxylate transporter TctB family protein [Paracoccus sp. Ld10]|uniref:tripartite tricarboxylate transporter TctB family protein n=1 Tax=Paracoccus sp. Ld10 TaxID=649158 RepID=UPI0038633B62
MSTPDKSDFAGEEEGAGYATPTVDMIAAILLIALAGWYTWEALGFRSPGGWRTGPGLVPAAAGISLLVMAIGLGVTAWARRGQTMPALDPETDEDSIGDPVRTAMLVGVIFVYLLAMDGISFGLAGYVAGYYLVVGSFEITTILCLSVLMKIFWNGPLARILLCSVGWTIFLSLTFRNIFLISLPR